VKTEPFFTVPKLPVSEILKGVEGTDASFALAVFVALRWLGNDERRPNGPVVATVAQIAHRAGVSYNTAAKALGALKALGVLHVGAQNLPGTKMRGPSCYTFPTIGGALPTEAPPRRAEIIQKERKEVKESCADPAKPSPAGKRSAKSPTPRTRDPVLDALATLDGSNLAQVTRSAWSGIAKALADIRQVSPAVTAEEIRHRAKNYASHFPQATLSAHALAKWWARCDRPPGGRDSHAGPAEPARLGSNLTK
jgi:hypothetical protein